MKILIIKRDKIGDMLLMTPMLEYLKSRNPSISVHVLANDYNAWVVHKNPYIDRLWVYPRSRHAGKLRISASFKELFITMRLRKTNFDFVIAAGGVISRRAIMRAHRIGKKRTVAYSDAKHRRFLSDPIWLDKKLHEVESNIKLLAPLGINSGGEIPYPSYHPPEASFSFASAWLASKQIDEFNYVVLAINARRDKRKPSGHQILSWSKYIYEKHGLYTVFVWQPGRTDDELYPGDDERISNFLLRLPSWVIPYPASQDIFPLLGVIWKSCLTIAPDGGLSHLASVSPGGVIALFADTAVSPHPDNWRPFSSRGKYLEAELSVSELNDHDVFDMVDSML